MKRTMALDMGSKRIGIAVSDPLGLVAQSYGAIIRESDNAAVEKIGEIIREKNVGAVVVGFPLALSGRAGGMARDASLFARKVAERFHVETVMIDERFSTAEAERLLLSADVSRRRRRQVRDKLAAQLILQTYLDREAARQ